MSRFVGAYDFRRHVTRYYNKELRLERENGALGQVENTPQGMKLTAGPEFKNDDKNEDYIRARRYMPEANGPRGTGLLPDYFQTGLFKTGVPHKITVIKHEQELFMHVRNAEKQMLCRWTNDSLPPITAGRIGLRHMYTRSACYRDIRICSR